jgi:hypothetical protein
MRQNSGMIIEPLPWRGCNGTHVVDRHVVSGVTQMLKSGSLDGGGRKT